MTDHIRSIGTQMAFLLINLHIATDRDLPPWLRTLAVLAVSCCLLTIGSLIPQLP